MMNVWLSVVQKKSSMKFRLSKVSSYAELLSPLAIGIFISNKLGLPSLPTFLLAGLLTLNSIIKLNRINSLEERILSGRLIDASIARACRVNPNELAQFLTDVETNEEYLQGLAKQMKLYVKYGDGGR